MSSYNSVTLVGRLGQDPEIRYSTDGAAFGSLSIATTETWKEKATGEKKERTEWTRIKVSGRLAEICGEYLHKGDLALFVGKLRTDKYTDKAGVEKYDTHVRADTMQMLSTKGGDTPRQESAPRRAAPAAAVDDMDSAIPF